MRLYAPASFASLAESFGTGEVPPGVAYAVTGGLRAWYEAGDRPAEDEELEYVAYLLAARASLRLLTNGGSARRRVVLAVEDGEDGAVADVDADEPGLVRLTRSLPWPAVVSVHVDDPSAEPAVVAALSHPDDETLLAALEEHELLWYGAQEVADLLRLGQES